MGVSPEDCSIRPAQGAEVRDALLLVLSSLAPEARAALIDSLKRHNNTKLNPLSSLWVIEHQDRLIAACWAQPQSGNAVTLWPPRATVALPRELISKLIQKVMSVVDQAQIQFTQILLEAGDDPRIESLEENDFKFVAKLEYLGRKTELGGNLESEEDTELQFFPFAEEEQQRLKEIVELSYIDTLDCPSLTGLRNIEDTLAGYRSTGTYRPENWFRIKKDQDDVGVLILAELDMGENYELVYMGLLTQFRGRGYGNQIVDFACQKASDNGAEQIMVAVDALNYPAQKAYQKNGFIPWANRWAYIRTSASVE